MLAPLMTKTFNDCRLHAALYAPRNLNSLGETQRRCLKAVSLHVLGAFVTVGVAVSPSCLSLRLLLNVPPRSLLSL